MKWLRALFRSNDQENEIQQNNYVNDKVRDDLPSLAGFKFGWFEQDLLKNGIAYLDDDVELLAETSHTTVGNVSPIKIDDVDFYILKINKELGLTSVTAVFQPILEDIIFAKYKELLLEKYPTASIDIATSDTMAITLGEVSIMLVKGQVLSLTYSLIKSFTDDQVKEMEGRREKEKLGL